MRPAMTVTVLVLLVAVGCGADTERAADPTTTTAVPAPTVLPQGQSIYDPPPELLAGPPGTLVWHTELGRMGDIRVWRTLTRSSDHTGSTWVTARVFRNEGTPPDGGFPVVVWVHGTAGLADECAPSRTGGTLPGLWNLLNAGYVVVAPDGAGLGVPGPAAYLVGSSEGHAVLDAARGAAQVPGVYANHDVALFGYSSGGHAALFAAQEAEAYAPEVDLRGTAAISPVADVARFAGRSTAFPLTFGYGFMALGAWAEIYDADLSNIFTPQVLDQLPLLDQRCGDRIAPHFALTPIDQLRVADPEVTEPWARLMAENTPGQVPTEGPVLLMHGTEDPIVASESTVALGERLCNLGVGTDVRLVPGAHEVVLPRTPEVVQWLTDRLEGVPAGDTCA